MIDTIRVNDTNIDYPAFQAEGNAAQFILPFAKQVCKGKGYDIGFGKEEWKLPGSIGIDINTDDEYDALNLPEGQVDYIFSSHCLEHLPNWVDALNYWLDNLVPNGVLFLYLPHKSQIYWRPYRNRKHIHVFDKDILRDYFDFKGVTKCFISDADLNNAFGVLIEK